LRNQARSVSETPVTGQTTVQYQGILISSDLPSSEAEMFGNFLAHSIKKELLPSHLEMGHMQDESSNQESQYVGNW